MATIGDVLTHLVQQSSTLSDVNRAEYLAAIDAAYPASAGPAANSAELSQAEADVAAAQAALAEAEAKAAASGGLN